MDEKERLIEQLGRATEQVNAAQDALDVELEARRKLMRDAMEAGMRVAEIARAAHVTRLVVYRQLEK